MFERFALPLQTQHARPEAKLYCSVLQLFVEIFAQNLHFSNRFAGFCVISRRGSNLSLLLDVSNLEVEAVCNVSTPKEVWLQLLHTSSRPLTHAALQEAAADAKAVDTEYQVKGTVFSH